MTAKKQAVSPVIEKNRRKSLLCGFGGAIQLKRAVISENSQKRLWRLCHA